MQVMIWLSLLAELSLIDLDSIENLAEFCRTLLERVGIDQGCVTLHLLGWRGPACQSCVSMAYHSSK